MSLTLTRKAGEKIVIQFPGAPDVLISARRESSGKLRFTIDAHPTIKIYREELLRDPIDTSEAME
jgi:sRNA-binding carbon storage regulator CsrA